MREIDKRSIEEYKIPGIVLMENAVLKLLKHIPMDMENYLIIAGPGNNGGDGIGVARQLYLNGKAVDLVLLGEGEKLKGDAWTNYEIVKRLKDAKQTPTLNIVELNPKSPKELKLPNVEALIAEADIIVDAIFGTGLSSEVGGLHSAVIEAVNLASAYVLAVDIPSGLNGDSGEVMGVAIKADKTVTLQYPKLGFQRSEVEEYLGELVVEEISIPKWI